MLPFLMNDVTVFEVTVFLHIKDFHNSYFSIIFGALTFVIGAKITVI